MTIDKYWEACVQKGIERQDEPGKITFRLSEERGVGATELWGDPETVMACVTDLTFTAPYVMFSSVEERYLQLTQYYEGDAVHYRTRDALEPAEHGLNYYVNVRKTSAYQRVMPGVRSVDVGFLYRARFFDELPEPLKSEFGETFWERAAAALNPKPVAIPAVTAICNELRCCTLEGAELSLYVYGRALEALAHTVRYVREHRPSRPVGLTAQDRCALECAREMLRERMADPPSIAELSAHLCINQQKLMRGFKMLNGMTIGDYLKRERMKRALELLGDTDLPVSQVARAVGYHGDGHFQAAFKQAYGLTPLKMRKELLGER